MVTQVGAGHIHCAILPKIVPNTHRNGDQRGFDAAAPDRNTRYRLICGYKHIRRVRKRTGLRQRRKRRLGRCRLLATSDGHRQDGNERQSCRAVENCYQSSLASKTREFSGDGAYVNPALSKPSPKERLGNLRPSRLMSSRLGRTGQRGRARDSGEPVGVGVTRGGVYRPDRHLRQRDLRGCRLLAKRLRPRTRISGSAVEPALRCRPCAAPEKAAPKQLNDGSARGRIRQLTTAFDRSRRT
jgi:hypothetical protein